MPSCCASGTTMGFVRRILESGGKVARRTFSWLTLPKRILPNKALKEFFENPRIVGGVGPRSTSRIADIFRYACNKVVETDATSAEVAKLAKNVYRDVNIALAN